VVIAFAITPDFRSSLYLAKPLVAPFLTFKLTIYSPSLVPFEIVLTTVTLPSGSLFELDTEVFVAIAASVLVFGSSHARCRRQV
jgi:hypothetical protein